MDDDTDGLDFADGDPGDGGGDGDGGDALDGMDLVEAIAAEVDDELIGEAGDEGDGDGDGEGDGSEGEGDGGTRKRTAKGDDGRVGSLAGLEALIKSRFKGDPSAFVEEFYNLSSQVKQLTEKGGDKDDAEPALTPEQWREQVKARQNADPEFVNQVEVWKAAKEELTAFDKQQTDLAGLCTKLQGEVQMLAGQVAQEPDPAKKAALQTQWMLKQVEFSNKANQYNIGLMLQPTKLREVENMRLAALRYGREVEQSMKDEQRQSRMKAGSNNRTLALFDRAFSQHVARFDFDPKNRAGDQEALDELREMTRMKLSAKLTQLKRQGLDGLDPADLHDAVREIMTDIAKKFRIRTVSGRSAPAPALRRRAGQQLPNNSHKFGGGRSGSGTLSRNGQSKLDKMLSTPEGVMKRADMIGEALARKGRASIS